MKILGYIMTESVVLAAFLVWWTGHGIGLAVALVGVYFLGGIRGMMEVFKH